MTQTTRGILFNSHSSTWWCFRRVSTRKRGEKAESWRYWRVRAEEDGDETNYNVFSCNTVLRFFDATFCLEDSVWSVFVKAEQSVASKQITLINTGCNLKKKKYMSSVLDVEATEVGNKTNSTVAVSLKSWHLDVWAKNCTHSATWPNCKCSHPKTPTPPPSLPQQSRALSSDSGLVWRAPPRVDPGTWPACLSAWWASRPVCPGERLPPPRPAIETKTWTDGSC